VHSLRCQAADKVQDIRMVYVKIHSSRGSSVLCVCDEDLIGKTLSEGNLAMMVTAKFYQGHVKPEEEVIMLMKSSTNINILGKDAIALALKAGVITEDNIRLIGGVSHAQVIA